MHLSIRSLHGGYALKVALAAVLVALGDIMFFQRLLHGGHVGLFLLALLSALVLSRPAVRRDIRAWAALLPATVYAVALVYDPSLLSWTMFWIAAGVATILPAVARFGDGWQWFQRLAFGGFLAIFGPAMDLAKLSQARLKRRASRFGLRSAIRTLALPVAGSVVILLMFSAANPIIDDMLSSLSIPEPTIENVVRLIVWGGLFTLAMALLRPRTPKRVLGTFDGSGDLALPGVSIASVTLSLIAFNLLFVLQNAMDAVWLWGLMPLPEGMTLAEYAHRGAYPLIVTALLAALFVLITLRPGSRTANVPLIRLLVIVWIGQNLFLVASSIERTLDYVDAYSLTELRIAALAWMVLVGIGLVLICWRMLRARSASWLINANLLTAGAMLSAFCFVDLGAVAAQWNVRHAREVDGTGSAIDLCYLDRLGGSSLLPLIELERRKLPGELGRRITSVREGVQGRLVVEMENGGWTWLNEERLRRAEKLQGASFKPGPPTGIPCERTQEGAAFHEEAMTVAVQPALPSGQPPARRPAELTGGKER